MQHTAIDLGSHRPIEAIGEPGLKSALLDRLSGFTTDEGRLSPASRSSPRLAPTNRQSFAREDCEVGALLGKLRITLSQITQFDVDEEQLEDLTSHQHLGLFCVVSGSGEVLLDGESINVHAGMAVLAPRDCAVSMRRGRQSNAAFVVCRAEISANLGQGFDYFDTFDRPIVHYGDTTLVLSSIRAIFDEAIERRLGARQIAEALLAVIMIRIIRGALAEIAVNAPIRLVLTQPNMARVINAITNNPGRYYSAQGLADIAGLTTQQLAQKFDEFFEQTPAAYLKGVRLKLAESMLLDTCLPVKAIAGHVGYGSRSHFSRTFRNHTGVDPTEFRQRQSVSG